MEPHPLDPCASSEALVRLKSAIIDLRTCRDMLYFIAGPIPEGSGLACFILALG